MVLETEDFSLLFIGKIACLRLICTDFIVHIPRQSKRFTTILCFQFTPVNMQHISSEYLFLFPSLWWAPAAKPAHRCSCFPFGLLHNAASVCLCVSEPRDEPDTKIILFGGFIDENQNSKQKAKTWWDFLAVKQESQVILPSCKTQSLITCFCGMNYTITAIIELFICLHLFSQSFTYLQNTFI